MKIHWRCLFGAIAKWVGSAVAIVVGFIIISLPLVWLKTEAESGGKWAEIVGIGIGGALALTWVGFMGWAVIWRPIKEWYEECVADKEPQPEEPIFVDIIRRDGVEVTGYTDLADDVCELLKRDYTGRYQIIVGLSELQVVELPDDSPHKTGE